jgi:hypothetical protein
MGFFDRFRRKTPDPDETIVEATWSAMEQRMQAAGFESDSKVINLLIPPFGGVPLNVHICRRASAFPIIALHTTGMSYRAMKPPRMHRERTHAELVMFLPRHWKPFEEDPKWGWPAQLLLYLAQYPHMEGHWVDTGHIVHIEQPPGTDFVAAFMVPPFDLDNSPDCDDSVRTDDGRDISILAVFPINSEELDFYREQGAMALLERAVPSMKCVPGRPSLV